MNTQHWRILVFLMIAEVVSGFEASMIYSGLSAWQRELRDPVLVGWIVSSYFLVGAAAAALFGRLGDIFGRKLMLVIVIALAGIGSAISAFGGTTEAVIIGRGIQGASGAIIPLCYGLANEYLPRDKVPFGVSMIVATAAVAAAVGFFVGGVLTDLYGPHSIFVSSAVLAAIVAPLVVFGLPRSPRKPMPANFDWLGGLLYAPGIGALLYAISEIDQPGALVALAVAVVLLGWWYLHEKRHPDPLMDVRLLSNRNYLFANLAMFAAAAGAMQLTQITSLLIQQPVETGTGLGRSATFMGAIKLPTLLLGILGSLAAGWLVVHRGYRMPLMLSALLIAAPCAVAAFAQDNLAILIAVLGIVQVGTNLAYAGIPSVVIAVTPSERTSEATGLMMVFRTTGQALGAQTIAVLMATALVRTPDGETYTAYSGYMLAFLFLTATGVALALFATRLRLPRAGSTAEPDTAQKELSA